MHDTTPESLRKQTLKQNGKTMSRKAQAKTTSLAPSLPGSSPASRASSAVPSRAGSEAGPSGSRPHSRLGMSDEDSPPPSFADLSIGGDDDLDEEAWVDFVAEVVQNLLDGDFWKHSNSQTRIQSLAAYARALLARYVPEQIETRQEELVDMLKKVVRTEDSPKEAVLALKALALTMATVPSHDLYERMAASLKTTIIDSCSVPVKAEAVHTLAMAALFGKVDPQTKIAIHNFMREIVSTDGEQIDALDVPEPVVAAIEAWTILATTLSESLMDYVQVFLDQLSSTSVPVMIAAGQAIALIYEKDHLAEEDADDSDPDASEQNESEQEDTDPDKVELAENGVDADDDGSRHRLLLERVRTLAKESSRRFSAPERKELHVNFSDILACVQDPSRGPRYSDAQAKETGAEFGHRLKIRMTPDAVAKVSRWQDLLRLNAIKRLLRDGFHVHWEDNPNVSELLPLEVSAIDSSKQRPGTPSKKTAGKKSMKGKKGARFNA